MPTSVGIAHASSQACYLTGELLDILYFKCHSGRRGSIYEVDRLKNNMWCEFEGIYTNEVKQIQPLSNSVR